MIHVGGVYASCNLFGGGSRASMSAKVEDALGPGAEEPDLEAVEDKILGLNQSVRRLELLLGRGWEGGSELRCGVVVAEPSVTPDEEMR